MSDTNRDNIIDLMNENTHLKAEVERLRMEATRVGVASYNPALVLANQEDEIERLQKERDEARGIATRSTLRSERLRKLLREALNGPGWQDEYWRSAAEEVLGNE